MAPRRLAGEGASGTLQFLAGDCINRVRPLSRWQHNAYCCLSRAFGKTGQAASAVSDGRLDVRTQFPNIRRERLHFRAQVTKPPTVGIVSDRVRLLQQATSSLLRVILVSGRACPAHTSTPGFCPEGEFESEQPMAALLRCS